MKAKGSITVFAALALSLVASFLFALLESARVYGLDTWAEMKSELGIESVCAEYQSELWDKYELLCLDGAYGGSDFSMEYVTGTLKSRIDKNLKTGDGCLFDLVLSDLEVGEYQLLTDGKGDVFLHRISDYMKENLPSEVLERLYKRYEEAQRIEEENSAENAVEDARESLEKAREEQTVAEAGVADRAGTGIDTVAGQGAASGVTGQGEATAGAAGGAKAGQGGAGSSIDVDRTDEGENLLEFVLDAKSNMVLGMVGQNLNEISVKKLSDANRLTKRNLQQGTMKESVDIGWQDKVLVLEYLEEHCSDYISPSEESALSYEMEYILCGKDSDKANLEGAANRLLLMREAANIVHIVSDAGKVKDAMFIAENTAGFTGNPAIIKAVQVGIVAAWAYLESIEDVRALLAGDKIALIKSDEQWTLQLENLVDIFSATSKAKNCENGLTYQDYLKVVLFAMGKEKLAKRAMDLFEQNIRQIPGCESFCMDHMICRMSYGLTYQSEPRFLSFMTIGKNSSNCYWFKKQVQFSY